MSLVSERLRSYGVFWSSLYRRMEPKKATSG